jgi:hypothetical protein
MHIWVAHCRFRNVVQYECDQVGELVLQAEVASALVLAIWVSLVDVHPVLCTFRGSADSLLDYCGKSESQLPDFHRPLPGIILSQPSTANLSETQLPESSLFGLCIAASWSGNVFPRFRCAKSLLSPFWLYSSQGACQTVQAVHYLLCFLW